MLVKLSWAGFHPQGSYERFSTHLMFVVLLSQASWHDSVPSVPSCFKTLHSYARMPLTTLPAHVGQAEVAALEAEGEPLVVDAQQVEHRGVQVVDVDHVLDGVVAELVGLAVA